MASAAVSIVPWDTLKLKSGLEENENVCRQMTLICDVGSAFKDKSTCCLPENYTRALVNRNGTVLIQFLQL